MLELLDTGLIDSTKLPSDVHALQMLDIGLLDSTNSKLPSTCGRYVEDYL